MHTFCFAVVCAAGSIAGAQVVGFSEDFNGDGAGYGGGSFQGLVADGGVGGVGDGYLLVGNDDLANLGAFATTGSGLVGDLPAAGVTGISFYLSELDTDDGLEIHVGVGNNFTNFWTTTIGFDADAGGWTQYTVDLTDASQWTQIFGNGSFEDALAATDRILFRHDVSPIVRSPDPATGFFGVDRITLLPAPGAAALLLAGAPFAIRRRR